MAVKTATPPSTQDTRADYWPPAQGQWTYEDYVGMPDNERRYEIIKGELYMSPAPRPIHQEIIGILYSYLLAYLKSNPLGKLYFAPIDLILPDLANPVQPDLLFISNDKLDIIKENFIEGIPDLIIEVLSPTNPTHDRRTKFRIYAEAGVPEYWIVDPEAGTIDINVLRGQAYALAGPFDKTQSVRSEVLPDFSMPVSEISQ